MKTLLSFFLIFFSTQAFAGHGVIFSGSNVKGLKSNLDLNGAAQILTGTADPTSSATTAQAGSIYINTSSTNVYRKNDNGSTTNWTLLSTGGGGTSSALIADGYWAGTATNCTLTRSSTTLGELSSGTVSGCPAYTVEVPASPAYTITSSSGAAPNVTVTNLPAGKYMVEVLINGKSASNGVQTQIGINDGTSTAGIMHYDESNNSNLQRTVRATFEYTVTTSPTFKIYVATAASASFTVNQETSTSGGGPVRMTIKRLQ